MLKISCNVILDLIPLVKDGVASDDSTIVVNDHIKNCESCKSEFETIEVAQSHESSIKDKKIVFAMKRSIFVTQIIILMAGSILGVALTNSMGQFYNFIIMPIIGGISVFAFKKKWYFTPLAIFIISYLWQTIMDIFTVGFLWIDLYKWLSYSIIYSILVVLGIIIAKLLKFAFKKER